MYITYKNMNEFAKVVLNCADLLDAGNCASCPLCGCCDAVISENEEDAVIRRGEILSDPMKPCVICDGERTIVNVGGKIKVYD